jgi:hypothetical protein
MSHKHIDTGRYFVLSPIVPYLDICLQSIAINRHEFSQIEKFAQRYQNDPRLIEMVRKGGDASAKVPYLMDAEETPDSILATLRKIAAQHVERIRSLPDSVQATIHLLLSINTMPRGCEMCGIPALLEIDRMQGEIVQSLRSLMVGRKMAADFHSNNIGALKALDADWPRLRGASNLILSNSSLPETSRTHYRPVFSNANRLVYLHETCVIVEAPDHRALRDLTPSVLQNPLPPNVPVPETGSADWLMRYIGKVGRHFTRALLGIMKARLETERVALEVNNYGLITEHALDAMRDYVEKNP